MIFKHLPIAFPWYDNQEKQNRYRENVKDKFQDWGLIAPSDSLLPFQFRISGGQTATSWLILDGGGNLVENLDPANLRTAVREGYKYFYFDGSSLGLSLAPGLYYSEVVLSGGGSYVSELFQVPPCSLIEFTKLEWYNKTDIRPIFYNDLNIQEVPYFKNIVYLDSFVHASEPAIEADGERDGNDRVVTTFERAIMRYRITEQVPDFLKTALVIMQMHDHVFLTTKGGLYSGEAESVAVSSTLDQGGAFSTVDIVIEDTLAMIKKGCSDNMAI